MQCSKFAFVVHFVAAPILCAISVLSNTQASLAVSAKADDFRVGLAKVDVTPEGPIRLSGFSSRQTESIGVRERIYARAMAIRNADGKPAVLITVDSIGIPIAVRNEIAHRLASKKNLPNERLAICATHSHTTPMVSGVLATMFGAPVPPDQQQRIDEYTRDLTDKLEQVAASALDDMKPARLQFGIGKANFSINRRTKGGPVDHELPVLQVLSLDEKFGRCMSVTRATASCCPTTKQAATGPAMRQQTSKKSIPAHWHSSQSAAAPIPTPSAA